jgi:hypothetical protein
LINMPFVRPRRGVGLISLLIALAAAVPATASTVPHSSHVVVVIMENKSYDETRVQGYTASLIAQSASFSNAFAVTHPSQPNYFALWAGSTLAVTNDNCPPTGAPFGAENLGHACEAAGLTWRAYSEDLPFAGATGCSYNGNTSTGLYTRKHDPWTYFTNLDHSSERPYSDLLSDLSAGTLPNLAFVVPNNCHNSHNSTSAGCSLADADVWLHANLPSILAALGPDGLLILTWDEDDSSANNHILTVFSGPTVLPGVVSAGTINHYSVVRTICQALGLTPFASAASASDITDVWAQPVAALPHSWGAVKALYR